MRHYAAFLCLLAVPALADVKLLRHPTYSKGRVAFSYFGDIWTANENGANVQRLTDNQARDVYPRFSPDGNWIAFSSNREGNYDIYVVAATGGKPKQLTFHTADDTAVGWTPDGKYILFSSVRAQGAFPTVATLFEVSPEGGSERPVPTDWGASGSYSPDGKKLAFMRHPGVWSRRHYRGSYAADLWVMDTAAKTYAKLGDADYKGNYFWPMYGASREIYFVSDRTPNEKNIKFAGPEVMKSVNNIWKIPETGGVPVQVTHHTDGNLYFPSISADRKTIVYEDNFGLWKLDLATGKSVEIRIDLKSDSKADDTPMVTVSEASAFHLSPSNRRAAVLVHGEVFTVATERGVPQRVTDSPSREDEPRWSPNGKWIAFTSDRGGRQEVWISDELGKSPRKLSDADCDKSQIVWAPDSKSLLWSGSDHQLRQVDVDTGKTTVLATGPFGNVTGAQFSPDGKWISYAKQDRLLRYQVWIKHLEKGDEHAIVSDQFQYSTGAKWTPDGKKLLFTGGISAPAMASQGFRGSPAQLYAVSLTRREKAPETREINTEEQALAQLNEPPPAGPGRRPATSAVNVAIDWEGFESRIQKLGSSAGPVTSVSASPDSKTVLFQVAGGGAPEYYVMREDGTGMQRLNTAVPDTGRRGAAGGGGGGRGFGFGGGNEPQWSRDGRSVYALLGGQLYSIPVPTLADAGDAPGGSRGGRGGQPVSASPASPTGAGPKRVDFAVSLTIDRAAERQQVFSEAWRIMKNRFYDAKMHGVNWAAAQDKYQSVLEHVADTEELHNVIMEMIGELNASHTGVSGGGLLPGESPRERLDTRHPGFTLKPDAASGYYQVESVLSKGPADRDYFQLAAGQYILAVNGAELKTTRNYWEFFNVLPGRKLEFLVNTKPSVDGARTLTIEPLAPQAAANLAYANWVEGRRKLVETMTKGEIGYLHIRAMDAPSLAKFQEDLIDLREKKALIIDQRFNGGGGIDQELLQILNQRNQYQRTRGRDSIEVVRPVQAFYGPMAVLQNERSASDAEMFPDGFRRLGLGKLIGMPTMGAVIGTGSYSLLDGSQLRTPGSGVYTATGENMENYGVPPDYMVDNGPADFFAGHDRQIEKAIEVLKSQMKP
ncbi:MAG: DPP IV N-terminal domain-containing protein [Bryobacteraceae bacterium]|nr:DPP IV N-terminal domain-containing protein [Bryobacteraceae bacterium]